MNWIYLYFFLLAFAVCLGLTALIRKTALKINFLDHPSDSRKIHQQPVPLMGGLALYLGFFGILWGHFLILKLFGGEFSFVPEVLVGHITGAIQQIPKLMVISIGATLLVILGLIDDKWGISPKTKLAWQSGAALFVAANGIQLSLFLENKLYTLLLSAFWIVLLTNSFNLLDNMDGLSAGIALIASLLFVAVAIFTKQYFLGISLSLLAGTLGGYLVWNFHPAKIFMGDSGSQLIGYLIAVLTLLETFYFKDFKVPYPVFMPLFILAVPIYDTASVILIRFKNGDSIFKADTRHFSHRIKALGMSTKGTVLFLYLVTLALGLAAPVLPFVTNSGAICLFIQGLCTLSVIAILEYFGEKKLKA